MLVIFVEFDNAVDLLKQKLIIETTQIGAYEASRTWMWGVMVTGTEDFVVCKTRKISCSADIWLVLILILVIIPKKSLFRGTKPASNNTKGPEVITLIALLQQCI